MKPANEPEPAKGLEEIQLTKNHNCVFTVTYRKAPANALHALWQQVSGPTVYIDGVCYKQPLVHVVRNFLAQLPYFLRLKKPRKTGITFSYRQYDAARTSSQWSTIPLVDNDIDLTKPPR